MKSLSFWTCFFGLLALILPFQNCSLYKSDGKKYLESEAIQIQTEEEEQSSEEEEESTTEKVTAQSGCSPYLSDRAAADIFEDENIELELRRDELTDRLICMISKRTDSSDGLDTAVCSISQEDLHLLHMGHSEALRDPQGELSGGSFGFISKTKLGTQLHFVGARQKGGEAARCSFSFEKDFDENSGLALERASLLVHEITTHL